MTAYPSIRKCFADVLQHGHNKVISEVLELFNFQRGDFTDEQHKALQAFDPTPQVTVLLAALERRLNEKRAKASPPTLAP